MTKPRLISISGSIHSGKTTISRMLALDDTTALYLNGDLIAAWVGAKYPDSSSIEDILPEVHQTIIDIVKAALEDGNDIIVDYPLSDKTRRQIIDSLRSVEFEAKWFLLKPNIDKVLKGSDKRPDLRDWERERVKRHYAGPLMESDLAIVIDSTDQTPEQTFKEIKESIK